MLDTKPDRATEQLSGQIDQLSRDVECLTGEWRVLLLRLNPLLEVAEKLLRGNRWWLK